MSPHKPVSNLSLGDSLGLLGLIFAGLSFVVDPGPGLRLLLLLGACVCSVVFILVSHWTYKWSKLSKFLASCFLLFVFWGRVLLHVSEQFPVFQGLLGTVNKVLALSRRPAARYLEAGLIGVLFTLTALLLIGLIVAAVKRRKGYISANKGFLDFKLDAEVAIAELPLRLLPISDVIDEVGQMFVAQTAIIVSAPVSETRTHLRNVRNTSRKLNKSTRKLRGLRRRLEETARRLNDGVTGWSLWMAQQERGSGVEVFVTAISGFVKGNIYAIEGTSRYLEQLDGMRGVSQHFNEALGAHRLEVELIRDVLKDMSVSSSAALQRLRPTVNEE